MQRKIYKQWNGLKMETNSLKVQPGHRTWLSGGVTFLSSPILATEVYLSYLIQKRCYVIFKASGKLT